jgi:ssDNA thymidine ADP-ribosyltransferase, DarT
MKDLTPEKASVFRITHVNNIPWILDHDLHCRNAQLYDPNYIEIGNPDLIQKRTSRTISIEPKGTLSDYIPFYFTPYSPMMLNIKTGYRGITKRSNDEIVIFITSLHKLKAEGTPFIFCDRHAYLDAAQFSNDLAHLDRICWQDLQNRDFKTDLARPDKMERYMAEALIYQHLPLDSLLGIVCNSVLVENKLKGLISARNLKVQTATRPNWYF